MKFNFEVKNLGKISHAKLKLAPFSVIAGTNSSGKSFVSRALYSFFSTINKDHLTAETIELADTAHALLRTGYSSIYDPSQIVSELYKEVFAAMEDLQKTIDNEFGACTLLEQHTRSIIIESKITKAESLLSKLEIEIGNKKKYSNFHEHMKLIVRQLKFLKQIVKAPIDMIGGKIAKGFNDALKENFQVANLSDLKSFDSKKDSFISFDFSELGNITIDKEVINFKLDSHSISEFQSLYNVVFIESPIYWKLRKPLSRVKETIPNFLRKFHKDSDGLTGVPKYFFDLIDLINQNIKSNSRSDDLYSIEKKISSILGGELDLSDSGDIFFSDSKCSQNVSLSLTATGVTNLGLIGLLLKRNVIAKGSFVFIDEPEVNLHPAWQKVMIEILYDLSKNGINVVIASHSIDMMKYIENLMDKLPEEDIEEHFAINRLSSDGYSIDINSSPKQAIAKIKEDLGSPFYEMILDGGW